MPIAIFLVGYSIVVAAVVNAKASAKIEAACRCVTDPLLFWAHRRAGWLPSLPLAAAIAAGSTRASVVVHAVGDRLSFSGGRARSSELGAALLDHGSSDVEPGGKVTLGGSE